MYSVTKLSILVFYILILVNINGVTQVDYIWEKIQSSGPYSFYGQGIELSDGRLLFVSYQSDSVSRIEILSKEGLLITKYDYSVPILKNVILKVFINHYNGHIILFGSAPPDLFTLTVMDADLNVLKYKSTPLSDSKHLFQIDGIIDGHKLLLVGNAWNGFFDESENSRVWFFKIDLERYDISSQLKILPEKSLFGQCYSIVKKVTDDGYFCVSAYLHSLDKDFKHISYEPKGNYISTENQVKAAQWANSSYLIGSSFGPGYGTPALNNYGVLLQVFDTAMIRKNYNGIKEFNIFGFPNSVFDYKNKNVIYLGGRDNLSQKQNRGFFVAQFDSLLRQKWQIYFTQDSRYRYTPTGLLALSDGGVIVYGARYDLLADKKFRSYMVKLDQTGGTTWIQDEALLPFSVKTYPNPSVDGILTLDVNTQYTELECRVFDQGGRNVFVSHTVINGQNNFDLRSLATGMYSVTIYNKGKILISNSWIKM